MLHSGVQQFLTQNDMTFVPHPPIHLQILPQGTFLFVYFLKGKHFANVVEVKQKMAEALKGIKIDEFKKFLEQWKTCLNRCIASLESSL